MHRGDIILIRFPFTDLTETKIRPAFVLSNTNLNRKYNDLILLAITSQKINDKSLEIEISEQDIQEGSIPKTSYIRLSKIVSLDKNLVINRVASLKSNKSLEIYNKFCNLIK